jgi:hypothetical protein
MAVARKLCPLLSIYHSIADELARELFEAYPELSRAVKLLSGMTFLTLLWKVFILFELADLAPAPYAARAEAEDEKANGEAKIMDDDAKATEGGHVYTRTGMEVVMGMLAEAGWACELTPVPVSWSVRVADPPRLRSISYDDLPRPLRSTCQRAW